MNYFTTVYPSTESNQQLEADFRAFILKHRQNVKKEVINLTNKPLLSVYNNVSLTKN